MKWLNHIRRMLGRKEKPPAVSSETSVLFCLQNMSPMTMGELQKATTIPIKDLRPVLDRLEMSGKVSVGPSANGSREEIDRRYWALTNRYHKGV